LEYFHLLARLLAVGKLASLYPHVEYNIIGDGHLKNSLQQLINQLNLTDKVQLLGWKNQQEIISMLDASPGQTHLELRFKALTMRNLYGRLDVFSLRRF
jgi:glycosyltransferase involved in cell wall biosynthesis